MDFLLGSKKSKKPSTSFDLPINHYINTKASIPVIIPTEQKTDSTSTDYTSFMTSAHGSNTSSAPAMAPVPGSSKDISLTPLVPIGPGSHSSSHSHTMSTEPSDSSSQDNVPDQGGDRGGDRGGDQGGDRGDDRGGIETDEASAQNRITRHTSVNIVPSGEQIVTDNISDRNTTVMDQNVLKVDTNGEAGTEDIGRRKHICSLCKKVFLQLGWLQKHMDKCQKGYKCDICPLRFKNSKCLKVHKINFHDPDSGFKCDRCGEWFSTNKKLIRHVSKVHEAEKICPHCNAKSKNNAALRQHKLWHCKGLNNNHYKLKVEAIKKKAEESANKARLSCKECNKVYSDRRGLRKHMKVHENFNTQSKQIENFENNKTNESQNTVEENLLVENHGPIEGLVFICDQNVPYGKPLQQGQVQNIELVLIDESKTD